MQASVLKLFRASLFLGIAQSLIESSLAWQHAPALLTCDIATEQQIFHARDRFVKLLHELGTSDAVLATNARELLT